MDNAEKCEKRQLSFFLIYMLLFLFLLRSYCRVPGKLSDSGESGYLCLLPDLREIAFSISS